jgi:hypothetical protein
MAIKRIHINQHVIRANGKTGQRRPTITVKEGKTNTYAQGVKILGPSEVIYSPDKPLACGAKVWLETTADLELTGVEQANESAIN